MEALGPAQPAPSVEELIALCSPAICKLIQSESSDETDDGRVWILRKIHKSYLYFRDLESFAPNLYQGVVDVSGIAGSIAPDDNGYGQFDYSQNIYRGYCRKLEAVLGTRMPNAIAVPDNAGDEADIRAANSANQAAEFIRQKCDLQAQILHLIFGIFCFGTNFWRIEWVVDGEKYGYSEVPQMSTGSTDLGGSGYDCPDCGAAADAGPNGEPPANCQSCGVPMTGAQFRPPVQVPTPETTGTKRIPKGGLEISLHDGSEISVPLDAESISKDVPWLRWEREVHKAFLYSNPKWGNRVRDAIKNTGLAGTEETVASEYGLAVRSSMGSPIGVVKTNRENRMTVADTYWLPEMYEMVDDQTVRQTLKQNFPKGLDITTLKNKIVYLEEKKLPAHWAECKPEPSKRIMGDPLGDDFIVPQDIKNNAINQCNELVERANEPGFADPTRLDIDALERRRATPASVIPMLPRAGQPLEASYFRPAPLQFSEQIPAFSAAVEENGKEITGLLDVIWGGDTSDPTARQTELKTNAAIRQLGVIWIMAGKSLEKVYEKGCRLLADYQDGAIAFSKKNQFGKYDNLTVDIDDLKNGHYHFEADEAIPMTWGQQRDLLMWMMGQPPEVLKYFGFDDPLNVPENKRLLGMPGERTPYLDDRDKCMAVISQLISDASKPGFQQPTGPPDPSAQPDPTTGQPPAGPPIPTVQPSWSDNNAFAAKLVRAYLTQNFKLEQSNPAAYQNIVLYGQAQDQIANKPAPPPPVKGSIAVALKGSDLGNLAVMDALGKSGLTDPNTEVQGDQIRQQELAAKQPTLPPKAPISGAAPVATVQN